MKKSSVVMLVSLAVVVLGFVLSKYGPDSIGSWAGLAGFVAFLVLGVTMAVVKIGDLRKKP